ncbi:MAG: LytR/AlgR family response regulator transcription factor [Clostridium sp.]|uniref:LytR/AlgR family response regulator transcription factor n=1 Tax=Clostridium sp. TaxID=1506 RepID=UPI003EE66B3B
MIRIGIYCGCDEEYKQLLLRNTQEVVNESKIAVEFKIFKDGLEILRLIENDNLLCDGFILDIDNEKLNILEIGEKIKRHSLSTSIIFISKNVNKIFKCLDIGAFNYILKKPEEGERLKKQFRKLIVEKNLIEGKFILVKKYGKHVRLKVRDIEYIEVINRVTYFKYKNKKIEFNEQISKLENELKKLRFVRCHRSFLVNLYFIKEIDRTEITLISGETIPVSRLKLKEVKEIFDTFIDNKEMILDKF